MKALHVAEISAITVAAALILFYCSVPVVAVLLGYPLYWGVEACGPLTCGLEWHRNPDMAWWFAGSQWIGYALAWFGAVVASLAVVSLPFAAVYFAVISKAGR